MFQLVAWLNGCCASALHLLGSPCRQWAEQQPLGQLRMGAVPSRLANGSEPRFLPEKNLSLQAGQAALQREGLALGSCDHQAFSQPRLHHGMRGMKTPPEYICPFERQHCSQGH